MLLDEVARVVKLRFEVQRQSDHAPTCCVVLRHHLARSKKHRRRTALLGACVVRVDPSLAPSPSLGTDTQHARRPARFLCVRSGRFLRPLARPAPRIRRHSNATSCCVCACRWRARDVRAVAGSGRVQRRQPRLRLRPRAHARCVLRKQRSAADPGARAYAFGRIPCGKC